MYTESHKTLKYGMNISHTSTCYKLLIVIKYLFLFHIQHISSVGYIIHVTTKKHVVVYRFLLFFFTIRHLYENLLVL